MALKTRYKQTLIMMKRNKIFCSPGPNG